MKSSIGDRIKKYEQAYNGKLTPRSCVIVRVDGKAFHSYTKHFNRPFDNNLINGMIVAAQKTAAQIQGFKVAYIQSDECTFLLTDFDRLNMQGWFDYEVNKIVSLTASYYTAFFNQYMGVDEVAAFDSRAFVVPEDDWANVFVWRQRDWERNSLQMLARSHYSHHELEGKNTAEMHEMLHEKGVNWAALKPVFKNGTFLINNGVPLTPLHEKLTYDNLVDIVSIREEL